MFHKRRPEAGARPGTLLLSPDLAPVRLNVTVVENGNCSVRSCTSVDELPEVDAPGSFVWVDVAGLGDGKVLSELSRRFKISPLAMEDLVNSPHRPKMELFDHQELIIAHSVPAETSSSAPSQLGIVFDQQYVITFHQACDHVLDPIRRRMENPAARLRRNGTDYLVYAILDACVDGCYPVLEKLGEKIEQLEEETLRRPRPDLLAEIHSVKNILARIRRSVWPQREMSLEVLHTDCEFISDATRVYLRDTVDHCTQLADMVDMYRESTSALVSTYMSAVAHRSNEIMKVLTLLTSVFVPPTFLAGVYGMNFNQMPELHLPYAYPVALATMGLMIAGTIFYFLQRGWLSSAPIADRSETSVHDTVVTERAPTKFVLDSGYDAIRKAA